MSMKDLWRPIEELGVEERYDTDFLLRAPELVDGDCNLQGVAPGYFQDDRDVPCGPEGAIREEGKDYGGWMAAKWSMSNDEWYDTPVTPTHYCRIEGPQLFTAKELEAVRD
jgi:hypothetical protein